MIVDDFGGVLIADAFARDIENVEDLCVCFGKYQVVQNACE